MLLRHPSVRGVLARVASVLVVLAASQAARASVLVVDPLVPGGFASAQDAVDAAASGDVILLRAHSSYFDIAGKSLTVVGDVGFVPGVTFGSVHDVPAGGAVVLRNIRLFGLTLSDVQGSVWIEDCEVVLGVPAAIDAHAVAQLHLQRVKATGSGSWVDVAGYGSGPGGRALDLEDTHAVVCDSTLTGGNGHGFIETVLGPALNQPGIDAVRVTGGSLDLVGGTLNGGKGGAGGTDLAFCYAGADGGVALRVTGDAPVVKFHGTQLYGGAGGAGPAGSCLFGDSAPGDYGAPLVVESGSATMYVGDATSLTVATPVREGEHVQLHVAAPAGAAVALVLAPAPGLQWVGKVVGPLQVAVPPLLLAVGAVPPSGTLEISALLPELGAGIDSVSLFLQALSALPGQAPEASSASVLVGLDAAF